MVRGPRGSVKRGAEAPSGLEPARGPAQYARLMNPAPSPPSDAGAPRGPLARALDLLERAGNRLPDPITIFAAIAVLTLAMSWLGARLGWQALHPADGSTIAAVNLLSSDNIRRILTEMVRNFTGFAPLGTVLVAMLGIGVAEASGLIGVSMRALVVRAPRAWLTPTVVFVGIIANLAADAGIVILPPVAALLYVAAGRHPLAGIAAAFAGVSGGFSANLLPNPLDVLLAGLSQAAVDSSGLLPGYTVEVLGNWFFLIAATPVLTVLGTWVTDRIIEPRLGPWRGEGAGEAQPISAGERRGLRWAAAAALAGTLLAALLVVPAGAPLRLPGATGIGELKPFFDSMVVLISFLFFVPGLAYGIATGSIRSDRDVARMSGEVMGTMGPFLVLAFIAGQVASWFSWSNLGALLAIGGADTLRSAGLGGPALLISMVVFTGGMNLLMTSATAKWAILAPIFVPMFALLGFTPEATQVAFRIGDSCANIITPLMPYVPFVLATMRRYRADAGVGQLIALMIPYSVVFVVSWTLLLLLFYALGLPIGPGVGFHLPR